MRNKLSITYFEGDQSWNKINKWGGIMERRSYKRLKVKIRAICEHKNFPYFVTINNCSENGMCISTRSVTPYLKDKINLLIPFGEGVVQLPAQICWSIKTTDYHCTTGLGLLHPSPKYLELLNRLR